MVGVARGGGRMMDFVFKVWLGQLMAVHEEGVLLGVMGVWW